MAPKRELSVSPPGGLTNRPKRAKPDSPEQASDGDDEASEAESSHESEGEESGAADSVHEDEPENDDSSSGDESEDEEEEEEEEKGEPNPFDNSDFDVDTSSGSDQSSGSERYPREEIYGSEVAPIQVEIMALDRDCRCPSADYEEHDNYFCPWCPDEVEQAWQCWANPKKPIRYLGLRAINILRDTTTDDKLPVFTYRFWINVAGVQMESEAYKWDEYLFHLELFGGDGPRASFNKALKMRDRARHQWWDFRDLPGWQHIHRLGLQELARGP